MYQLFFVGGVALTSVSNGALIIGATPSPSPPCRRLMGREKIGVLHWLGAAVSVAGIYFVVGRGASFGGTTLRGDLLVMISVGCWTAYTLGGAPADQAPLAALRHRHDDGDRRRAVRDPRAAADPAA